MGLERIAAVMQGVDNYDIDTFKALMRRRSALARRTMASESERPPSSPTITFIGTPRWQTALREDHRQETPVMKYCPWKSPRMGRRRPRPRIALMYRLPALTTEMSAAYPELIRRAGALFAETLEREGGQGHQA